MCSSDLLTVTGAYKATAIRNLETEAAVPPLDLYLNKRLADFEVRLARSGLDEVVDEARLKIVRRFGRYQRRGCWRIQQLS